MKAKYSFVCEAANIAQSGNLNVLGIFTNINAAHVPCVYPKFAYVANIEFHRSESGKHSFKLSFINDDGKDIIQPISGHMDVAQNQGLPSSANLLVELANITFPTAGAYEIDLTIDNQHICTETIHVIDNSQIKSNYV